MSFSSNYSLYSRIDIILKLDLLEAFSHSLGEYRTSAVEPRTEGSGECTEGNLHETLMNVQQLESCLLSAILCIDDDGYPIGASTKCHPGSSRFPDISQSYCCKLTQLVLPNLDAKKAFHVEGFRS